MCPTPLAGFLHWFSRASHGFITVTAIGALGFAGTALATPLPVRFDFKVLPITSSTPAVVAMANVTPRNTVTANASVQTNGTGIVTRVTGISVPGVSGPLSLSPCSGVSTCITATVTGPITGNWTRTAAAGFGAISVPGLIRAQFLTGGGPGAVTLTLPLSQAFNFGSAAATTPLPTLTSLGQPLSGSAFVQGSGWVDTTAVNFTIPSSATVSGIGRISTPGGAPTSQWRIGNTLNAVTPTLIATSRFDPDFTVIDANGSVAFIGLSMTVVPEPSTGLLAGLGCIGLAVWGRRTQKRHRTE